MTPQFSPGSESSLPVGAAGFSLRAAYLHVPFCIHRCGYCDFTVIAGRDDLVPAYLHALRCELEQLRTPRPVETIFIGGGTPTQLAPADLTQLLRFVREWFPLQTHGEFSVEANPQGLDGPRLQVLADAGVNRLSLGVQSFDSQVLEVLERDHRFEDIHQAVTTARLYFSNISLDLIFGVPGQTLESWQSTLQQAIVLRPQHISTYGLTFEKGTPFWNRRRKGELQQTDEDLERAMYALAMNQLAAAGYQQYELSNFAKPGFECRHNQVYWAGEGYYAAGPGAARYINGRRETNHRSVTGWIERLRRGQSPVMDAEELSAEERAREMLMLGLRRTAGIDCELFARQSGFRVEELAKDALRKHLAGGFVEETPRGTIRLTRAGRFVADAVIVDFL